MKEPASRIGAVVLAAGGSSRLGRPKQLVVHEGLPLVARAAQAALETGVIRWSWFSVRTRRWCARLFPEFPSSRS